MKNHYTIKKARNIPSLNSGWNGNEWARAEIAKISIFRDRSSDHHPKTEVKLLYDDKGIYGQFNVEDQYVRAVNTGYQTTVCKDSCVEFFVKPKKDKGYLNFEFNCGGSLLCYYVIDNTRTENGFKEFVELQNSDLDKVEVFHSLPVEVNPEITVATQWSLAFFIPFEVLETYTGKIQIAPKMTWSANFYKCADDTSHPHWASWNPITATNFHLPECFGDIEFE